MRILQGGACFWTTSSFPRIYPLPCAFDRSILNAEGSEHDPKMQGMEEGGLPGDGLESQVLRGAETYSMLTASSPSSSRQKPCQYCETQEPQRPQGTRDSNMNPGLHLGSWLMAVVQESCALKGLWGWKDGRPSRGVDRWPCGKWAQCFGSL